MCAKKKNEPIDFNAYNLRPAGSYLNDLIRDMNQVMNEAENVMAGRDADTSAAANADQPAEAMAEPEKTQEELLAELDALIGLDNIKEEVRSLINLVKVRRLREENDLKSPTMSLHLVFMGNPGTGKTTVARLLAQLYRSIGVLSQGQLIEVDRSGLVAGYVGQTAIKTSEVIAKALGGILFIDEAYALTPGDGAANDFGHEAVETILKAMEDHRDDFVVIVAGYENLMERFISSNPGLESRFNRYFMFEDYTGEELYRILLMQCNKNQYVLSGEADAYARELLNSLYETRDENFGNGRTVRNLFEKAVTYQSNRLAEADAPDREALMLIEKVDLEAAACAL